MVLSRRERVILIVTAVVVGALFLDKLIWTPAMKRLERTESRKQQLLAELNEANSLFERRSLMQRKWRAMMADGLGSDAEAQSRVGRSLNEWSGRTRLTLTSVKPERGAVDKGLREITFTVAARGRLDSVARFLYQVETAELPVKIKDMQLGSASESGDDMSLQLRLSVLCLDGGPAPSEKQSQPRQRVTDNDQAQLL
jgi:Tfp pilus assembly protein PilO